MAQSSGTAAPPQDIVQHGYVDVVISPTQFQSYELQEEGDGYFFGWTVFVTRKGDGTINPPLGEEQICSAFVSNGGVVTCPAFTHSLSVGDEILMIQPNIGAGLLATLAAILAAIGAVSVAAETLSVYGKVTNIPGANQFDIAPLAGMGNTKFVNWVGYVWRTAGGVGGAPQGENQLVTVYNSALGRFTTNAYTVPVGVGDELLLMHPRFWDIINTATNVGNAAADTLKSVIAKLGNLARSLTTELGSRWNVAGDLGTDIAALLANTAGSGGGGGGSTTNINVTFMVTRPLRGLYEGWQIEAVIVPDIWITTNPASGAAWAIAANGADLMASAAPNASENARLASVQRWIVGPGVYGTNKILRRLTLEFELVVAGLANFDNTNFILGLTAGQTDTRSSNNLIGFALVGAGNALQTVTRAAGAETVNTGFGETLTNKNKLKIDIYAGHVDFYLNENLIASQVANLANLPMYLDFYAPTTGGGAATISLGVVRAWTEDIAR